MLITPVVLTVVELAGNVFWTLLWQGFPGRFVTLGSVMAGVFVVGCFLVYKIHIVGAVRSALIMMLYVFAKAVFVVAMTYAYLYPMGVYTPSPFSSWYIEESWRGREVAGVTADFPGEFLEMNYSQRGSEKQGNGRYTVAEAFVTDFGTYQVCVAQVSGIKGWIDPSTNIVSTVGFLLQQSGLDRGRGYRDASPIRAEFAVSGLSGQRLQSEYLNRGKKEEVDAVFIAEEYSGWVILVYGNRGEVKGISTRIFNSLEIPNESRRRAKAEPQETRDSGADVVTDPKPEEGRSSVPSVYPMDRVITNKEGTRIEVKIRGRTESRLIFEMEDGQTFGYPIRDLSPEDQDFVKKLPISRN